MAYLKTKPSGQMCSECFAEFSYEEWKKFNFCPDCGSRINHNNELDSEWVIYDTGYVCCRVCNYNSRYFYRYCPQCGYAMINGG